MTTDVLIQVTELQKHFKGTQQSQDDKIRALDGVSAQIHRGEVVVVIGPSGSGKSTFLRCLNLLELPTGGQILFDGADITDKNCNINLHRQKMGMVFQHFNLFPHMTILKNMTIAPMQLLHKSKEDARKDRAGAFVPCRACRPRERLSQPALRRAEAACCHRPRAGNAARGHALRRADELRSTLRWSARCWRS